MIHSYSQYSVQATKTSYDGKDGVMEKKFGILNAGGEALRKIERGTLPPNSSRLYRRFTSARAVRRNFLDLLKTKFINRLNEYE